MIHLDISYLDLALFMAGLLGIALVAVILFLTIVAEPFLRVLDNMALARAERIAQYEAMCASCPQHGVQSVAEVQPVEPVAAEPVEPAPVVHVGELIAAPPKDILPPAPPTLDDVPLFASVPFTYPASMPDFGFSFWGSSSSWATPTGAYEIVTAPSVEASVEPSTDPAPKARDRFATPKPPHKVAVKAVPEAPAQMVEVS